MLSDRKTVFNKIREAQLLFDNEDYTRAFNLLNNIERESRHLHLLSKIATFKMQCLIAVGNIEAAIHYIETLISQYPDSASINFIAAGYYHKMGDDDKAHRLYLRSVCLRPEHIPYSLGFANFLKDHYRFKKALKTLRRCLFHNSPHKNRGSSSLYFLYLNIGILYHQLGNFRRALVFLEYASQLDEYFPYKDSIADCYLRLNRPERALKITEEYFEEWGESDPSVLFVYAKSLVGCGRHAEALAALEKCSNIWGELVITARDIAHLSPLLQSGELRRLPNTFIEVV